MITEDTVADDRDRVTRLVDPRDGSEKEFIERGGQQMVSSANTPERPASPPPPPPPSGGKKS
jgi:hypothetical protein